MSAPRSAQQVLDEELLALRAKLLEIAAGLDRVDRAGGPPADEASMATLRASIETLLRSDGSRAEQIQLLFSRPFEDSWRERLEV